MEPKLITLSEEQECEIRYYLDEYNAKHIKYRLDGMMRIGLEKDGELIAGLIAYMSVYKILYVDTVFVDERYRRQGYGRKLILEMERQAEEQGVNTIRLDTFNWQGTEFYKSLGYEAAGSYANEEDGFEETFFVKRI
ncbi:MAG: GNAT family N-acetyltransferase [Lachnospiraceae bacterium]|nr:GNAT family N-acetyltransferase [Lachnospiraceae bacterium]